jgi:cobalt transporter subunit CbtA
MIGRYVLAALVAGMLAGLVLSGIQYLRLSPMILAAEVFETAEPAAAGESCKETMPGMTMCHDHGATAWEPAPGLQRFGSTTVASLLAGGGFAAVLAGLSLLLNVPITRANGWIWGTLGFLTVHVATSAGLPPELPGMPVADLAPRQLWWVSTIIATGAAIYLLTQRREIWAPFLAIALAALPHILGAPEAHHQMNSAVPPALASAFAANAIAAAAVFWLVMGVLLGHILPRFALDDSND